MKLRLPKLLLAGSCLATGAIAGSGIANAADVTVYGKANVNYNYVDVSGAGSEDASQWNLSSAASRLGFKGSEDISDNLKAIFKMEFEVQIDGSDSDQVFKQRNSYVGLQGNWGTVIAGIHDTPLKVSEGKIDLFNDLLYGDIANIFVGENRNNDIIMYTTPKFSGFAATVGVLTGDAEDPGEGNQSDNPVDSVSATVYYTGENLYAALAVDNSVNQNNIIRGTTVYTTGSWQLGALYQYAEESDNNEGLGKVKGLIEFAEKNLALDFNFKEMHGGMLSASYKLDKWVFKGQYSMANYKNNAGDTDVYLTTVGLDYKFTKRTKLYNYYTYSRLDQAVDLGVEDDLEANVVGTIGLEHKF